MQLDRFELRGGATGDGAALDGGHVLVGMEAEAHQVAEAADAPPAPGGTDGVCRVLDDAQPVPRGDVVQPLHVHRQPGEVHRQDGARARRDRRLGLPEVDVARVEPDVDEHRPCADTHDHVRRRHEAQRRRDDLIAPAYAAGEQRHLQPGGRRGLRADRAPAEVRRQLRLELRHHGSARQPARAQHLADCGDGVLVDARPGEGQLRLHRSVRIVHREFITSAPPAPRQARSRRYRRRAARWAPRRAATRRARC